MELTRSNWKDIERYFSQTWVKFHEFGDKMFFISNVKPSGLTGIDEDGVDFLLELHDDQPYNLEYVLPHKAVFQYGNRAVMMLRVPAKQYRRGLCSENTRCIYPDTHGDGSSAIGITEKVLKAYTNKDKYCSFTEAFKTKKEKRTSIALSPRMLAVKKSGAIYVDTTHVATYNRELNSIIVIKPNFKEDMLRHVQAFNDDMEVV
jgi:hypothetical protein